MKSKKTKKMRKDAVVAEEEPDLAAASRALEHEYARLGKRLVSLRLSERTRREITNRMLKLRGHIFPR
jgi:hypothetical protein